MNTEINQIAADAPFGREERKTDFVWWTACAAVTLTAVFLRFFWLELKPLHHDEGVNGFFLTTLFRDGVYKYDPANYHGPDLYYFALAFSKIFGLNTISIRSSVAIFGVLTVILAFFLKNYIGKIGSIFAALFLALSPGMVYISRYFIHEIIFVFFSFAIVTGVVFFLERRKAGVFAIGWTSLLLLVCFAPSTINLARIIGGDSETTVSILQIVFFLIEAALVFLIVRMIAAWDEGRPIYLILSSAAAVLLFATKETAFITIATMLIAIVCVWLWRKISAVEIFADHKRWIFLGATVPALIGVTVAHTQIIELFKTFSEFFKNGETNQRVVFYSILALILVAAAAWFAVLFTKYQTNNLEINSSADNALVWSNFRAKLGDSANFWLIFAAVFAVFTYVGILFFSSFFTYPDGVKKAFEAYTIWTKTGSKDHTQNGNLGYIKWGMKIESPILVLSALGVLLAFWKADNRFAVFTAFWTVGMFAAYTIIPYKTPWLALSFILPMCIIAGYAIGELLRSNNLAQKITGGILAVLASGILAFQTYDLNFLRYDSDAMPYVYAHTERGFLDLIKKIEYYADKSGKGKDATIEIVSPDYWSMPWYMNDYPHANFNGQLIEVNTAEMIVAKKGEQDAEVVPRYSSHYKFVAQYPLRPGVELMLLVRKDLAEPDAKELYKIMGEPSDR